MMIKLKYEVIKLGIGKNLKELIDLRNTNVNELARNADVSAQTIYAIIKRDNKKADINVLLKISKILEVPVDYFFNYDRPDSKFLDEILNEDDNKQKHQKQLFEKTLDEEKNIQKQKKDFLNEILKKEDKKHYAKIAGYGGGVKTIELDNKEKQDEYYALVKNNNEGYDEIYMTEEEFLKIRDMLDIIRK